MPTPTTNNDVAAARRWASFYRDVRGYQPLPSRTDAKRPMLRYSQWWESKAPADLFERFETTNVQIMTGRFWRLLVIDLDGPEAVARWTAMTSHAPRTWITHSGGGGRHVWFTVDPACRPLPKAVLWRPDPDSPRVKGEPAIERLCDHSLVMAPPSIHPTTGNPYRFLARCSPKDVGIPAPCPRWLLNAPAVVATRPVLSLPERSPIRPTARPGSFVRAADVLDAIGDKTALAESWGLRIASTRPNVSGWCSCHAIGREDRNPSASFNPTTGRYWEPDTRTAGLFDLAVLLGVYARWEDARDDLADRYRVRGIA